MEYAIFSNLNFQLMLQGLPALVYTPDRSFRDSDFYGWSGIDQLYKGTYRDDQLYYLNGSFAPSSTASERYHSGEQKGIELLEMLSDGRMTLSERETIKLVGYSMGAAYAAGMANVISQNEMYASRLEFVDYLAPHQPGLFEHPIGVSGRQFQIDTDWFAGSNREY